MEAVRKLIHIGLIVPALLFRFPWFEPWMMMAGAVLAFLACLTVVPRLGRRLFRPEEDVPSAGMLLYSLSVFLVVLLFWSFGGAPHVAAAAWALLAVGDGLSTLLGKSFGRERLPWNPRKTYLGFAAFLLGGTFGAAFLLWFVSPRTATPVLWSQAYLVGLAAAIVAGAVESFPWRINDNLSVPLIGGAVIYLFDAVEGRLVAILFENHWRIFSYALLAGVILAVAYHKRLVELPTAVAGWVLGFLMLLFTGLRGFGFLAVYFTALELLARYVDVRKPGKAGKRPASYEVRNLLATVGPAVFLALWGAITLHRGFFAVAMVAALATAFADSVAAGLGQIYGGRPFVIPSFRRVSPGTPGAVSLAGTVSGLAAALALALVAFVLQLLPTPIHVLVVTVAALAGITWESAFGPSLTRRGLGPHTLNFLCTVAGCLAAMVLYWLI